ncbi:MAG: R3H domain-containing nucleic acid-binding protein [bacterium]|nr:R3H domain-containing nucleic acid-binding protein [bacterium]
MAQSNIKKIQEIIGEFFGKTGIIVEAIEIKTPQDSTIPINLKMEDPQVLIGEGGQTLMEVQRLLKLVLQKKIASEARFYIDLDINDYKKKKTDYLKEMAKSTADEVSLIKKEKYLPPMSAYDRRVIHVELAGRQDIITESVGFEPERMVAIKPRLL